MQEIWHLPALQVSFWLKASRVAQVRLPMLRHELLSACSLTGSQKSLTATCFKLDTEFQTNVMASPPLIQFALAAAALTAATLWATAITEESVTLVEGLGVVLGARRRCGPPASTFVPAERIRHVIINEVPHCRSTPVACTTTGMVT